MVYSSWLGQLSCALQKANVACLRSAAAAGPCPVPGVCAGGGAGVASDNATAAENDWLAEQVEELLLQAAAAAAVELA